MNVMNVHIPDLQLIMIFLILWVLISRYEKSIIKLWLIYESFGKLMECKHERTIMNVNITIITAGKLKEKYLKQGMAEYLKRLSKYAKINIVEVQDEKTRSEERRVGKVAKERARK